MGTMTLQNFRSELLFDLRNRTDTTTADGLDATRQNRYINAGYLHITQPSVFRHRQMQYTTAIPLINGQMDYVFSPDPTGVIITAIRAATHAIGGGPSTSRLTKLYPKDIQWFLARSSQSGAPREYFVEANKVNLNPVPSANEAGTFLILSTWREPTLLVDGATTVLDSVFDEVLLLAARWRAELHLGYRDLAETTKLDFVGLLNEYKDFEQLHGEDFDWQVDLVSDSPMERA